MSEKAFNTFNIGGGGSFEITLIFALLTSSPALDTLKGFKFKIRRRFFERSFEKGSFDGMEDFASVSDSDLEFSSAVIAMNSSNSEKISSLRRVLSKSSSMISSITSILKHVSSFE
ncbi:hypothetical protein Tco_1000556 [Tanacetum coccineum]